LLKNSLFRISEYAIILEVKFLICYYSFEGWGYKYSHKSSHLCYAFFEKGAFTVTVQIGDKQVHSVENSMTSPLITAIVDAGSLIVLFGIAMLMLGAAVAV